MTRKTRPVRSTPLNQSPTPQKSTSLKQISLGFILFDLAKGGIARYTANLIPELVTAGVRISGLVIMTKFCMDEDALRIIQRYCPVYNVGEEDMSEYGIPTDKSAAERLVSDSDIITFAAIGPNLMTMDWKFPVTHGKPTLHQVHGTCMWTRNNVTYNKDNTQHYLAVSPMVEKLILEIVPEASITTIPFNLDFNRVIPTEDWLTTRRRLLDSAECSLEMGSDVALRSPWVLFFGRFAPDKNIPLLARSLYTLCVAADSSMYDMPPSSLAKLKHTVGVFVGTGWNVVKEREGIRSNLPGHYIIAEWADHIGNVINAADLSVTLSDTEGGPMSLIESLAIGCPAMSTPTGMMVNLERPGHMPGPLGIPHIIHHGASRQLVAERIAAILAPREPGVRTAADYENARIVAAKFHPKTVKGQWMELLGKLTGRQSAEPECRE